MSRTGSTYRRNTFRIAVITTLVAGALLAAPAANAATCLVGAGYATIQAAIDDVACDEITVPAGTYFENLVVSRSVVINGEGAATTVIDASGSGSVVQINALDVTLTGLTITNGNAPDGGGIYNTSGSVTLIDSIITGNTAENGAGILSATSGSVTLTDTTVTGNTATNEGGGIYGFASPMTLTDSTITNNTAQYGAGIYSTTESVTLTGSTLSDNTATLNGGAIYNGSSGGSVILTGSTLTGNTAGQGGGIYNDTFGSVTASNTTFSDNTANHGGGIYNFTDGSVTLTNSTLSTNSAHFNGGGIYNYVGGSVALTNTTVTDNSATAAGGIFNYGPGAVLTVEQSIVAANAAGTSPEIDNSTGAAVTSYGYNVFGTVAGFTPAGTDLVGVSIPGLGPLADNGGATWTHALLAGSPAINLTPIANCATTTDQRGIARPVGVGCDAGSFELDVLVCVVGSGYATIQAAIDDPVCGDVTVPAGTYFENLIVSRPVSISGAGAATTIIDGSNAGPVVQIDAQDDTAPVVLAGLTITNGSGRGIDNGSLGSVMLVDSTVTGNGGGGIANFTSEMTLIDTTIAGNSATNGGGIYNFRSSVVLTNSTVTGNTATNGGGIYGDQSSANSTSSIIGDNTATNQGGGIYNTGFGGVFLNTSTLTGNTATQGGGIYNTGFAGSTSVTLTNSTVSGNTATSDGGGIYNYANGEVMSTNSAVSGNTAGTNGGGIHNSFGWVYLTNMTITANSANDGGGIYNFGPDPLVTVTVSQSIVAANTAATGPDIDNTTGATVTSGGYNVLGTVVGFTPAGTDLSGVPVPGLGPLADNGGPTFTHALLAGSPAINLVPSVSCATGTDQRGVTRPIGTGCDAGSFELEALVCVVGSGYATIQDAVDDPACVEVTVPAGTYFENLIVSRAVPINGAGAATTIIDASGTGSVVQINALDVTLTGLTITNGNAPDGGGVVNYGSVTLIDSIISGNTAENGAGILSATSGSVTLTNTTVTGNTATNEGGGIFGYGSPVTLTNSTVSSNTAPLGGGIYSTTGSVTLTNSTVSGNTADDGGGIYNTGIFGATSLTLTNTTVTDNTATNRGGGIFNSLSASSLAVEQSLVAANTAVTGPDIDNSATATVTSNGYNVFGAVVGFTPAGTDLVGVSIPGLGPLADNGGPTFTHALLAGSPAVDLTPIANCATTTDQRGTARPFGIGCDAGSYEAELLPDASAPAVVLVAPVNGSTVGAPVAISGTATDNVGVTEVRIEIYSRDFTNWWNGDDWQPDRTYVTAVLAVPGGTDTTWTYSFDPPIPDVLPYWVTARAYDAANNRSTRPTTNFTIGDTVEPGIVLVAPVNGSTVGAPVAISGTATDNVGVTQVRIEIYSRDRGDWWNGGNWQPDRTYVTATVVPPNGTDTTWTYSFDPPTPDALPYWVTARAYDAANNRSTRPTTNFTIE